MNTQLPDRLALWSPPLDLTDAEMRFCSRMKTTGKFYAFLRRERLTIFDEPFQRKLLAMYSQDAAGAPPLPLAMMALITILQCYEKCSDADAVEQKVFDLRWQMVLGLPNDGEAAFSQGALSEFRARLIKHDMDKQVLEKTVEVAKITKGFGYKQLRVALDSAPLTGAGRVEDTFNLIGHALVLVVACAAAAHECEKSEIIAEAKLTLVCSTSTKAALDIDWNDADAQHQALQRLLGEVASVQQWVESKPLDRKKALPVAAALDVLKQVAEQDLEAAPRPDGTRAIADGTAKDRRISIEDGDMRHGRKSSSNLIDGYKRYVANDLDTGLILAAAVLPANRPESDGADLLRPDIEKYGVLKELHIDRGFLASTWVADFDKAGGEVFCKPWTSTNGDRTPKSLFIIDTVAKTVQCPAGQKVTYRAQTVTFPTDACKACPQRDGCTKSTKGGRTIRLHEQEPLMQKLQLAVSTPQGRKNLRPRTGVEHVQAHTCRIQGPTARYLGTRKNDFDLRRTAIVYNLLAVA